MAKIYSFPNCLNLTGAEATLENGESAAEFLQSAIAEVRNV